MADAHTLFDALALPSRMTRATRNTAALPDVMKIFDRADGSSFRRQATWGAGETKAEPAACRRRIAAL